MKSKRDAIKVLHDSGMRIAEISRESVRRIVKSILGLKAYKQHEPHLLTEKMMATRLQRCKRLKHRFAAGRHRSIVFSDEKLFTIEQSVNRQNDRIWSREAPQHERIIGRSQKSKSVMVWAGVTHNGKTPLVFIEEGVKVNQHVYLEKILEKALFP
uniref:Transposase n=1 Tax=Plectus sambesii TaxID=2011161 RepID=A0A914VAL1_9BILA